MDKLTDIVVRGNHTQGIIAHVLRMGGRKTNSHIGNLFRHTIQQDREGYGLTFFLERIGVYILSQQRNFLKAFLVHIPYLIQDTLDIPATLASSCIRYDAIRTEIITTAHNRHETGDMYAR